jgi:hypothetical protein
VWLVKLNAWPLRGREVVVAFCNILHVPVAWRWELR